MKASIPLRIDPRRSAVGDAPLRGLCVSRALQVKPEIQTQRALFADRDPRPQHFTPANERQMLRNPAGRDHAHMGAALVGRQDRAGDVEPAEPDGRFRVRGGVNEMLAGHAVRIRLLEGSRLGHIRCVLCRRAATASTNAPVQRSVMCLDPAANAARCACADRRWKAYSVPGFQHR